MNFIDFLRKLLGLNVKSKPTNELELENNSGTKIVKSFGFLDLDFNESLNFELLPSNNINQNWKPVKLNNIELENIKGFLSELTKSTANVGIASQMTKGLYRASANPEILMKLNDGGIGSAIMNGNKISGSAGFLEAGSTFFTPLIIFQAISFAVGQAYMQTISRQLNSIQEKLNELISLHHINREVIMELSYETFQRFSLKEKFRNEDFIEISKQLSELKQIRLEYKKLSEDSINNIAFEEKSIDSKKSAKASVNSFEKSGFLFKIEKSLIADDLYRLGKLVEFNMKNKFGKLSFDDLEDLKLANENSFSHSVFTLYNNSKTKLFENLNKHKKKTLINNEDINTIIANQANKFQLLEKDINYRTNEVNEKYRTILISLEKKQDLVLDLRTEIPKLYLN